MSDYESADRKVYMTLGVMLGATVGLVAGMMTSPKSGVELRADMLDRAKKVRDKTQAQLASKQSMVEDKLGSALDKSKQVADTVTTKAKNVADTTAAHANRAADKAHDSLDDRSINDL